MGRGTVSGQAWTPRGRAWVTPDGNRALRLAVGSALCQRLPRQTDRGPRAEAAQTHRRLPPGPASSTPVFGERSRSSSVGPLTPSPPINEPRDASPLLQRPMFWKGLVPGTDGASRRMFLGEASGQKGSGWRWGRAGPLSPCGEVSPCAPCGARPHFGFKMLLSQNDLPLQEDTETHKQIRCTQALARSLRSGAPKPSCLPAR